MRPRFERFLLSVCLASATFVAMAIDDQVIIDTTSERLLVDTCAHLRNATRFTVDIDSEYEEVLLDGTTVTYHRNDAVLVERPDKLRLDVVDDRGLRRIFVNPDNVVVYRPVNDVYAEIEVSGTLDQRLDKLEAKGVVLPLGDLLRTKPCDDLVEQMRRATFAGTHYVNGQMAKHLLIETDHADMQVWIADGDAPQIVKLVIHYRELMGEPRFTARLSNWDIATVNDSEFRFSPSPQSERVDFRKPTATWRGEQ